MDPVSLPVLSLADDPRRFASAIGDSFRRFGFALVRDHGIDPALIAQGWRLTAEFFALPEAEKRRYTIAGLAGARGYTPFGVEIAKGARAHDLKEFWHVGRDLPPGHALAAAMPPNLWPERPAGFRDTFAALFAAFDRVGTTILSRIAVHLGLAPDWFDHAIADGNSVLRLLHYPPVAAAADGAIRAGAHEDINLITLLLGAEEAGLELLDKRGRWLPVTPPEGALAINIGDMLQRLTNHALPSTTHRVRNPAGDRSGRSRYSMPFFLHLRSDFRLRTLPQCVDADNPDRYPVPITADEYLQERLREIGLRQ
ncbi:MAG: 2-oxoglutarate and iron-dependent oxygenase domain-containing protein [Novosphingobium sp.]